VEVHIQERGATLIKVEWPGAFEHLEAWIYASDVVEELSDTALGGELEQWLSTLGNSEDASDADALPVQKAALHGGN
jgi:hypothetical protein